MYAYNQDAAIRDYVERTFAIYDLDHSGTLDINEFPRFISDWYANHGVQVQMTQHQAIEIMKTMDPNFDGHITKQELHMAMARMGQNPQPYVQAYQPMPNHQPMQQRPTVIIVKGKNVTWQWMSLMIVSLKLAYKINKHNHNYG